MRCVIAVILCALSSLRYAKAGPIIDEQQFKNGVALFYGMSMNLATGMGLITEDNDVLTIPKLYAAGCIHTIQNGGNTLVCAPFRMSPDGTFITLSVLQPHNGMHFEFWKAKDQKGEGHIIGLADGVLMIQDVDYHVSGKHGSEISSRYFLTSNIVPPCDFLIISMRLAGVYLRHVRDNRVLFCVFRRLVMPVP